MRAPDPILVNALANQQGELILRVLTWSTAAAYNAAPAVPEHTWIVKAFDILSTEAKATLVTENDYTVSDFEVFIIERGVKLSGTEYTVQSGLFFVRSYREDYGEIQISGSSYPNQKISIAAGDGTYQEVIEAFCAAIGKTAVFKNPLDPWLAYQFLPDGKGLSLNKAELFENLLRQKYCILVYEESPNNLVFYNQDTFTHNQLFSVAWSPELEIFCAISQSGTNRVMTSPDGINWTPRAAAEANTWQSICWSPELGLFCAVASDGTNRVQTSSDGITWTARAAAEANSWVSVCWSPALGLFCAVSLAGTNQVMTSPDGAVWTAQAEAEANIWRSVTWSSELGLFCAVAQTGTNRVMTSANGTDWTAHAAAEASTWFSVCWSSELGLFCAVAQTGTNRVMTSANGTDWTAHAAAEANSWVSVCWSPELGLFCAVAISGTNRVMTSANGTDWTAHAATEANLWTSVVWSPALGIFCAVTVNGTNRVMTSINGIDWIARTVATNFYLSYLDGPASYLDRQQSAVHFLWRDEAGTLHTDGDLTDPQWNLGYLESTDNAPTTREDAYYKIYLLKAPVRLDMTDADKIHFTPYWSIDPTKTIDAMMQVSEHLNLAKSPAWYQEIKSIVLFDKTEGGALPSTIERVAAYTPLVSTGFDGNLSPAVNNLQAFAQAVDDMDIPAIAGVPTTTAENDFQVGGVGGTIGTWVKKTLAQTITILRTSLDSIYVPMARAITTTTPITIAGTTSADLSADRTIAIPAATAAVNGYATSVQITKLDGIAAGSQVNVLEGVTGTAPIVAGAIAAKSQAISLVNDVAGTITQIDTATLSALDTDIPTSKAVGTAISTHAALRTGVHGMNASYQIIQQGAPNATGTGATTLSIAKLKTGICTGTPNAARAYTLDTGANCDAGMTIAVNEAFDWVLINLDTTATDIITVTSPDASHTIVGNPLVAAQSATTGGLWGTSSAIFRTRKTAADTFITYRIA